MGKNKNKNDRNNNTTLIKGYQPVASEGETVMPKGGTGESGPKESESNQSKTHTTEQN